MDEKSEGLVLFQVARHIGFALVGAFSWLCARRRFRVQSAMNNSHFYERRQVSLASREESYGHAGRLSTRRDQRKWHTHPAPPTSAISCTEREVANCREHSKTLVSAGHFISSISRYPRRVRGLDVHSAPPPDLLFRLCFRLFEWR